MKRITSCIAALTLIFSIVSMGLPQLSGKAAAATATVAQHHTFETTDPNFGSFAVGAAISPVPTMIGLETAFSKTIVSDANGNRSMEVIVPADAQGKTRFYYSANAGLQATGNRFTFEGALTFSNQAKEFDLKVIPGDWKQNLPIAKFLPSGDIQVKSGTVTQTTWSKRGTWTANTTYAVKLDLYKDINKYDLFITNTSTGITTMLASGEPLMNYDNHSFLETGVVYYNIEAVGTTASSSTSVRYDDIKISYSDDVRDAYIPASDTAVLRTTTFETNDTDTSIAGTATGAVIKTNILDQSSPSTMKIVEQSGSRWVEVTTARDQKGDIGFPIYQNWASDSSTRSNSYTLEADILLKDQNADYYLNSINGTWGDSKSDILLFGKNGNLYARTTNQLKEGMAARTTWAVGQPFSIKLVVHIDSKSYDLYHVAGGVTTKLVNSEPIRDMDYSSGLAAFMLHVKEGLHNESSILVDNIKVSVSNVAGTAPIIHANPGESLNTTPVIGVPVNYYVSPNGLDTNDGKSLSTPFQSIQKAADLSAPGDTIYLMDGTWTYNGKGRMLIITKSGALNTQTNVPAYITYKAAPGAKPVLFAQSGWDAISIQANYIKIDGLEVRGNNQNLTVADGEAAYNYYADSVNNGTAIDYGDARFTKTNTNGITVDGRANVDKGLEPFHHITISNNVVHDMSGGGINIMGTDYVTIENNLVYNNSWYTMYATSGISLLGSVDIDNKTDYKSIVRNNIVHHNQTNVKWGSVQRYSDGNGIIIDYNRNTGKIYPAYKGKTLVENNLVYNNGGSGIHSFNSAYVDIVNNTLYNNNQNPMLSYSQLFASTSEYVNIFNNIVYSRDLRPGETSYSVNNANGSDYVIYANNIYYNGSPAVMGINDVVANPQFISLDPGSTDFLRLKSNSPAIDQGTQTLAPSVDYVKAPRPQGAKFDIGAFETSYTSSNPIVNDVIDIAAVRQSMIFVPENGVARKGTPVIDGMIDDIWLTTPFINVNKYIDNPTAPVTSGATAKARVLWDEDNLYVLSEVADPVLRKTNVNKHEQDSVEIFLDENNGKTTAHEADDRQYRINFDNEKSVGRQGNVSEFESETDLIPGGYLVEVKIPLKTIKGMDGKVIGLDFQVNDDDGSGKRTSSAIWSDVKGNGYSNTSRWGNVTLLAQASNPITAIQPVQVTTVEGVAPVLPSVVSAVYSNAATATLAVVWDTIQPESYAQAGSFTVSGAVYGTAIQAVANVTVIPKAADYAITLGAEQQGGAGKTRTITISGESAANVAGKYLIVQFTEGTGVNAHVSVVMIAATSETATISYAEAGTKVDAWLASGMPDLAGQNLGVTLYAYASTSN